MNTVTSSQAETSTETTATTRTDQVPAGGRRKARIAGLVVALLAGLFTIFGQAAPAQAAGSYSTGVYFCTTANQPVQLQVWVNGAWQPYKNGNSGATGCATFRYVDGGYWYSVVRQTSFRDPYNCRNSFTSTWSTDAAWSVAGRVVNAGSLYFRGTHTWC